MENLEKELIIQEYKDRKENYRWYDQQRNNFIHFYILFFSGFLLIINNISESDNGFLDLIPLSLCHKQKIGILILIFYLVGFLWYVIIKHLRKTQIANALVAAMISTKHSTYLGHSLLYPFDKDCRFLRMLGYTSFIDIIFIFLNSVLMLLGIFNIFTDLDTIQKCIIIFVVVCLNNCLPKIINEKLLKYEPVFLKESIKRYIDILGYKKSK